MKKIVFATHNDHKLKEVRQMLKGVVKVVGLNELGLQEEIPENASTLEGNALLKMQFVYDKFGMDCFADDTGLEVYSLGGEPGVYSARYAGEPADSEKNIDKLLKKLELQPDRRARFRTVIALMSEGEKTLFSGCIEGEILKERCGANGFGYDSIFRPYNYDKTFAQMNEVEKNSISHRSIAISRLREFLEYGTVFCPF